MIFASHSSPTVPARSGGRPPDQCRGQHFRRAFQPLPRFRRQCFCRRQLLAGNRGSPGRFAGALFDPGPAAKSGAHALRPLYAQGRKFGRAAARFATFNQCRPPRCQSNVSRASSPSTGRVGIGTTNPGAASMSRASCRPMRSTGMAPASAMSPRPRFPRGSPNGFGGWPYPFVAVTNAGNAPDVAGGGRRAFRLPHRPV